MKVTKLRKSHVKLLKEYNNSKFPFPNLASPLYIIRGAIVDKDNNLLGAGFIKLTAEAIIILDPKIGKINKATAIYKLFDAARRGMVKKGLDGVHAFTNDVNFQSFLKKRFGFEKSDDALYLRL